MESELLINYIYNVDEKPLRAGHVIWISGNFPLPDFLFEEIIHHFIKKRRKIILIVMKKSPKLHNYWFFFFFSREVIKSTLQQQQLYQHVHPVSGQWTLFSFLFNMLVRKKNKFKVLSMVLNRLSTATMSTWMQPHEQHIWSSPIYIW